MKKLLALLILISPFVLSAQTLKLLKKTITLKMPKTVDDDMPGTRGASVAWHPVLKKYYASFAGNVAYPMAVFDATGKRLSGDDLNTMADTRGLWYNTKLKTICGNGYNETGWFSYMLDKKGIPEDVDIYSEGMNQPDEQSVGAYNAKGNMVYFLSGQEIRVYNAEAEEEEDSTIRLYAGIAKEDDIDEDTDDESFLDTDIYNSALIYTGTPKAEFGLLNYEKNQVELYNRKTGLMTKILKLPEDVVTYGSFNFSYSNGIYWLFNQDTRTWTGYK